MTRLYGQICDKALTLVIKRYKLNKQILIFYFNDILIDRIF